MQLEKRKFDYKWVIFCLCFLMNFVCLGFCSSNKGLYLSAITDPKALDLPRSLFSINDSCRFIATALINLFFGTLIYKFGFRKMAIFGFSCLIASSLLYSVAENIYVFYVGGALLGLGASFTTTTMTGSLIRRWFKNDIGKYTGIVFAANGIGGALAAQIITPLIFDESDPFGYRTSYRLVALITLITGIIVVALLRERPKDQPVSPVPVKKRNARGRSWEGLPFETIKKRPYFYMIAAGTLMTGFILQGIGGVYAAHFKDVGIDSGYLATVTSIYSLALTVSKILVGFVYDKKGLRFILLMCQSATVIAFTLLLLVSNTITGKALAILFALLYAIALPLETLVIPLVVNDAFGTAAYDKVLGIMTAMNYTGYALGTPAINLCYDISGTYTPVFIAFIVLMPIIAIGFQFALRGVNKDKLAYQNNNTINK